jgi:hypothetical protein
MDLCLISEEKKLSKAGLKRDSQRLELVKSHVAKGFYDRHDIVEATASAVIKSQALHVLLDRYEIREFACCSALQRTSSQSARIAEIRRRIDDGFYDDPNNLAELAERLIKKLGLE